MRFIVITTVKPSVAANPPADYVRHLDEEVAQTRRGFSDGVISQAWHRADGSGIVVVFDADSPESANAMIADFWLVRAGYVDVEVVPLHDFPIV